MSIRRQFSRGGALVSAGQVAEQAVVFVRNVILARLLGAEDMGVAATFAATVALIQMTSNLSADKLLVQARDGDSEDLQGASHLLQVARGVVTALALFLIAAPVANLFDVPEAIWAYQMLALVPLVRGFEHLDPKRLNRELEFRPMVAMELGSQVVVTAMSWPLARWLGDYSAVLWLVVGQAILYTVMSHMVARRPYRWRWSLELTRRVFGFGWPLLLNGVLLFGIMQGDRVIVGAAYPMETLGVYSIAFGLAMMPSLMLARVSTSMFLPMLSQAQDDRAQFERRYQLSVQMTCVASCALLALFVAAGGRLITLIYGAEYAAAEQFIGVLAAMQAVRMIRVAPTLGAMAFGDTANSLIANIWRSTGLALAVVVAFVAMPIVWIAAAGLVGEALALFASSRRLSRRHGVTWRTMQAPLAALGIVLVVALVAELVIHAALPLSDDGSAMPLLASVAIGGALAVVSALGAALQPGQLRREVMDGLARLRHESRAGAAAEGKA